MTDYMVDGKAYRWANRRIDELETERDKALSDAERLKMMNLILSQDLERLREALERIAKHQYAHSLPPDAHPDERTFGEIARRALNPERGE